MNCRVYTNQLHPPSLPPTGTHLDSTDGSSGHDTSTVSVPRAEGNDSGLDISNGSVRAQSWATCDP
jgi:hypothetical protein